MKPSIRNKILSIVVSALALLTLLAGLANWKFNRINANRETVAIASTALRDQLEADMMHDALRADVLGALHAAAAKDSAALAAAGKELEEHAEHFRASIKANERLPLDAAIVNALGTVEKPLHDYIQSAESIVALAAKDAKAAEAQWPAFQESFSQLEGAMEKVSDTIEANQKTINEASDSLVAQFRLTVGITLGFALIALAMLAWFITRGIVATLDEIGRQLAAGAGQLTASAGEVAESSKTLADSASQQAASLEETSASLEEISAMTRRNAESASNGATLGGQARESAAAGLSRLGELTRTLEGIKSAVNEMQTAVTETQASSQQVSKIIKTIDEIAFQTNLLALNAAVEAARAGEAGMGFAVVADEVRALAQRSAQAAKDTSEKIEAAVKRSELGGAASAKVVKSLLEVEETAQNIQQVFTGIVGQIQALDGVISQIAAASQEQTSGISEVNMAVSQMDKVTQSNAAGAEENAGSATVLNAQAATLVQAVESLQAVVSGEAAVGNATAAGSAPQTKHEDFGAGFARHRQTSPTKGKTRATNQFQNF
ncbi:MAG: methyl-accepting chemotaxis protein [Chthoniobacter sp.]|nr:methyl-accepting chemotaxis protein [Chthoniobacter sp.]